MPDKLIRVEEEIYKRFVVHCANKNIKLKAMIEKLIEKEMKKKKKS